MEIIVSLFLKRKVGVTEFPRPLNPSKAIVMAICPIIVHSSNWRARSVLDVACEFARAVVRSKDAQKQLARTSLSLDSFLNVLPRLQKKRKLRHFRDYLQTDRKWLIVYDTMRSIYEIK